MHSGALEAAWASDVASSLHLNRPAYLQAGITTLRRPQVTFVGLFDSAAFHPTHWSGKIRLRKGGAVIWQVTADRPRLVAELVSLCYQRRAYRHVIV